MRLNYMAAPGQYISHNDIHTGAKMFFDKFHTVPDTLKMTFNDMSMLMTSLHIPPQMLESGKKYSVFLPIPGGLLELLILESDNETTHNGQPMFVFESSQVDREFEKHVLNKDT